MLQFIPVLVIFIFMVSLKVECILKKFPKGKLETVFPISFMIYMTMVIDRVPEFFVNISH